MTPAAWSFTAAIRRQAAYVDLRFEMNTLVVLDDLPASARSGVRLSARGDAADGLAFAAGAAQRSLPYPVPGERARFQEH